MSTDYFKAVKPAMCDAVRTYPPNGQLVRCAVAGAELHPWHRSAAPLRMYWPAQPYGCHRWRTVATAQGPVVVVCALPLAGGHTQHEASIGVHPVRWKA